MAAPDRNLLAQRIQGFGNVNPPPLEEETGATVAKRAIGRLGDMVGEEVMLTVEDFREKGAVGAVKDAVADAGDILIDGVSGLVGWIRGDPPVDEEDTAKSEEATKALSNGPGGAAYGISQASPTGGINAVWVMPEDADPQALAQLASQGGKVGQQVNDPRVPKNIQPYQPAASKTTMPPLPGAGGFQAPGGISIAPYQPAPSGPAGMRPAPFVPGLLPGAQPGLQQGKWGPSGYGPAPGVSASGSSGTGSKAFVERIAKGEVIVGADSVKRLVSQCQATKTTAKQLGEMVCERARRLYLGLDGGDAGDTDESLARLLGLANALAQQGTDFSKEAVKVISSGVSEEFLSLRSSAKHKDLAEPMIRRLGLGGQGGAAPAPETADLLGGGAATATATAQADLLGGAASAAPAAKEADLLGGGGGGEADLLGGGGGSSSLADALAPAASASNAQPLSFDPILTPADPASAGAGPGLLGGVTFDAAPAAAPTPAPGASMAAMSSMGAVAPAGHAALAAMATGKAEKSKDTFDFVGDEMSKATKK